MLRYAVAATAIVGGFVMVLAASFERPSGVGPRTEHPTEAPAGQNGTSAGSVVSVVSEQTRLQSEVDVMMGALRSAAAHQLRQFEAALTGPKAGPPPAAALPAPKAAPAAVPPAPKAASAAVPPARLKAVLAAVPPASPKAAQAAVPPASPKTAVAAATAPAPTASVLLMGVAPPKQTVPRPVPRKFAPQVHSGRHPEMASVETQPRPDVVQPALPEARSPARAPPAVTQLVSAGRALQSNDADGARGLLEAAETSVVFAPAAAGSRGNSIAAVQITAALRMVAAGDPARAMQYVARALTALRPASPSSGATVQADLSR